MNPASNMRSGNPALGAEAFRSGDVAVGAEVMTIGGAVNKTAIALVLVVLAAAYTWQIGMADPAAVQPYTLGGVIGGLVAAMVTIFKREWAPITTPIYALLEGLALGGISAMFEPQSTNVSAASKSS